MAGDGNNTKDDGFNDEDEVRDFYKAVPPERVPPELDDRVLQLATLEAARDKWFGWLIPWLRPAAFAATVGLSLAVLLELNELSTSTDGLPTVDSLDRSTDIVDGFNAAAEDSSDRIRSIGDSAQERKLQGDDLANEYSPANDESAFAGYCPAQQSSSPEAWQRCIAELRQAGRDAEANSEMQRFRKSHPNYPTHAN